MPQSLVLNLTAQSAIPPRYRQGYALQQLFFNLIEAVDPQLGRILRRDKTNQSYSLSALQCASSLLPKINAKRLRHQLTEIIPSQASCWWQVTFLDDLLFDQIADLWQILRGERFELGSAHLTIDRVITEAPNKAPNDKKIEKAWAGLTAVSSYSDLYARASAHERDIHLEFVTPTVFDHLGVFSPIPSAENLFQPIRKRWNHHSALVFPASLIDSLAPLYFNIQTHPVQSFFQDSLQTMVGCSGKISFRIGSQQPASTIKHINALADFACFCGVGHQAQFGMGGIRRSHLSPTASRQTQAHL